MRNSPLLTFEFNNNDLRTVVDPKRKNAVSHTSAHDHIHPSRGTKSGIIFRKQTLIGRHQSAGEGQTELAAVGMTAEHQIHTVAVIAASPLNFSWSIFLHR